MKKIFILLIFFTISLTNFAYSISPDVFIQSTVNRASQILSENISKEEKINKLKMIAKETVDIRGVGLYSLGSARKNLNNEQNKIYIDLFENYFLKSFSSRLAEYTNPKIEVKNKNTIHHMLSHQKLEITFWIVNVKYIPKNNLYQKINLKDISKYPFPKPLKNFLEIRARTT